MIELGEPYLSTWRGRPPAMLDPDVPVWYKFLDVHGSEYDRFYYNVRLTTRDLKKEFPNPEHHDLAQFLLPKRIDAVGEKDERYTIFEVAERAGLRSLGQLATYQAIWLAERPEDKGKVQTALVTTHIGPDEILAAQGAGITVTTVAD